MSQNYFPELQSQQNAESFVEFLQELKKKGNEERIEFAKKMFTDTYYECIQEGMNSHYALQKAIRVAFSFLIEVKM